tara:strand:+ start:1943 stop:2314 length:372 start_codon:yes stop_codon:yes gene_type:complete
MNFTKKLDIKAKEILDLLKEKNQAYGNSALKPAKIFSQLDATESLCSRIDDKLMRIKNRGIYDATEDTVKDLVGYLMLLLMAIEDKADKEYEELAESIKLGGFANINGTPIDSLDLLKEKLKR